MQQLPEVRELLFSAQKIRVAAYKNRYRLRLI